METTDITVLTREDLKARGWTARQIRKQKPDTVIRVKHRGRPKFGHSLVNILAIEAAIAEAKAVVAESKQPAVVAESKQPAPSAQPVAAVA